MGFCCHPTRRQFLQWAGLVAATPLLASLERRPARADAPVAAVNLELVTLTETSAILTWFTGYPTQPPDQFGRLVPLATDTEVWLGSSSGRLKQAFYDAAPTAYHYVELTGLEPGRPYFFAALSNHTPALPAGSYAGSPFGTSTLGPGAALPPLSFRTPLPPPGSYLFSIALCNDLHLGETVAGLATSVNGVGVPPGITGDHYPNVMARALAVVTTALVNTGPPMR
jgi:hypothetical protein